MKFKIKVVHTFRLLTLIAAIIYGISITKSTEVYFIPRLNPLYFLTVYSHHLFWGFGLSVTGAIFCVVSGILVGFARKRQL
ncbi:hypothetical protein KUTeg_015287 [Tegillarca granosa]|uniref:Uncharacterized protein n=1 Tax=Tegillarca granosa TaxID=220873 RepID=A0ABQ9EPP6_TEGGR|nr:hypothetical protein KUTeg_015287 [Tegillarca granosa]